MPCPRHREDTTIGSISAFHIPQDQPEQADDLPGALRNPNSLRAHLSEMPVKMQAGIIAADGRVLVNLTMVLYQLSP